MTDTAIPGGEKRLAIRDARLADVPGLSRVLARAFADDPMVEWLVKPDARREERTALLFSAYLRLLSLPHGMAYTTDDMVGGALWSPPGQWQMGLAAQARFLPAFLGTTGLARAPACYIGVQQVLGAHPREPHFYLQVLGVDPEAQGRGWGSLLLRHGLAVVDAARMPAYLETMNSDNIAFYERHGFRVTGEVKVFGKNLPVWLLWRDAQRG